MSDARIHCDSCGKILPNPQAVCPACNAQLARDLKTSTRGKHLCPVCSQGFDRPVFELWPRGAKWYTPRQMKPTCPHCKAFLLDRKNPPLPAKLIWLLVGATVVAYLAVPSGYEEPVLGVMLAIYAAASWRFRGSRVSDRERYGRVEA